MVGHETQRGIGRVGTDKHDGAELDLMFVANHRRRSGIGSMLVADMFERARALNVHRVFVIAHPPAQPFYEAMGGREIGHGTVDEEGYELPVTVYGWADIRSLSGGAG